MKFLNKLIAPRPLAVKASTAVDIREEDNREVLIVRLDNETFAVKLAYHAWAIVKKEN